MPTETTDLAAVARRQASQMSVLPEHTIMVAMADEIDRLSEIASFAQTIAATDADPFNDPLFEEMDAAIDGAYTSAPPGEGVMGALYFAARAAVLVARGAKAPEAVAKAIGEVGTYGVKRLYGVVPRQPTEAMLVAARDWSYAKYDKPIGDDAALGCWKAMMEAAENG